MNEEQFTQLCRDVSFLLGEEDGEALGKFGKISLHNKAITVFFDEEIDSSEIVLYIDMISLNNTDRESILSILMGMNLLNNHHQLGICALDPIRNIAILKKNIFINDVYTSDQFAMQMLDLVNYVNQICAQLPELISNLNNSLSSRNKISQSV